MFQHKATMDCKGRLHSESGHAPLPPHATAFYHTHGMVTRTIIGIVDGGIGFRDG